jgi:hypothetical protein
MNIMRAKLQLESVTTYQGGTEKLTFNAVCKSGGYPSDGSDEDNTYALFSPSARLDITITNPALYGKFKPGKKFYVDFTEASK